MTRAEIILNEASKQGHWSKPYIKKATDKTIDISKKYLDKRKEKKAHQMELQKRVQYWGY